MIRPMVPMHLQLENAGSTLYSKCSGPVEPTRRSTGPTASIQRVLSSWKTKPKENGSKGFEAHTHGRGGRWGWLCLPCRRDPADDPSDRLNEPAPRLDPWTSGSNPKTDNAKTQHYVNRQNFFDR